MDTESVLLSLPGICSLRRELEDLRTGGAAGVGLVGRATFLR